MNWFDGKTLLVPWDYSDMAKDALQQAVVMADGPERIHTAHVAAPMSASEPGIVWGTVDDRKREASLREEFTKSTKELGDIQFHVLFGDAGTELTELARQIPVDCIVIPSHGRTGLQHLLIGSVAERVVRLAKCPVLVLRK